MILSHIFIHILGHKGEYIPLLVAIMVIFSTAFFGFILPKILDYTRNRYRDELQAALSIEKSLKERQQYHNAESYKEPELEKIISHLKKQYLDNRKEQIAQDGSPRRWNFERTAGELLIAVAAIILVITAVSFLMLGFIRLFI